MYKVLPEDVSSMKKIKEWRESDEKGEGHSGRVVREVGRGWAAPGTARRPGGWRAGSKGKSRTRDSRGRAHKA